jgi:Protein of unknown function (DUF2934)
MATVSDKTQEDILDIDLEEQVRHRAYAIWESEGRPGGREGEHWHQAMQEIVNLSCSLGPAAKAKGPAKKAPAKKAPAKSAARPSRRNPRAAQVTLN